MMSLQMVLMTVWVGADLGPLCLLHLALATKLIWDMKSSVVVAPLQHSLMYKDSRDSQAPGEEKKRKEKYASFNSTDKWNIKHGIGPMLDVFFKRKKSLKNELIELFYLMFFLINA